MPGKFTKGAGVYRNETDLSEVATPVGTSVGAIVDKASKGLVNQRVLLTRDKQCIETFGQPDDVNYGYGVWGALQYLKESDSLYFVRCTNGSETYAIKGFGTNASGTSVTLSATSTTALLAISGYEDGNKPNDNKDIEGTSVGSELFNIGCVGPGTYGNNIGIEIVTSASGTKYDWANRYDLDPSAASAIGKKVFKVNVYVKESVDSSFANVSASPVESFYVTKQNLLDGNGNQLEMAQVINGVSKYIYVKNGGSVVYPTATTGIVALTGGTDVTSVSVGNFVSGWSLFNDREKVTVNVLICTHAGDNSSANYPVQLACGNVAGSRKDCISVSQIDSVSSTNVDTIISNCGYGYNFQSYTALYAGWDKIYDQYNDKNIFIPKAIFGASIFARVDAVKDTWEAAAGSDVGSISSIGQNKVFNSTEIGKLRDANINTSRQISGSTIMWAQRTAQRKNTAVSDINVRRLLLFVENTLENTLNEFIFSLNNSATRLRIKSACESFLSQVAAGGGFNTDNDAGFLVVCDTTNNTSQEIDNNTIVVDVYVKPIRVAEFIELNTIVTRSGVNFNELVGA